MKGRRAMPYSLRWHRSGGAARVFPKYQRLRILALTSLVALIVIAGVGLTSRIVNDDRRSVPVVPLVASHPNIARKDHNNMSSTPSANDTTPSVLSEPRRAVVDEVVARFLGPSTFFTVPHRGDGAAPRWFLDLRKLGASTAASLLAAGARHSLLSVLQDAFVNALARANDAAAPPPNDALHQAMEYLAARHQHAEGVASIVAGLDLGSNQLSSLTADLASLASTLEVLFLTDNLFDRTPEVLVQMRVLNRLSLKSNRLASLHPQRDLPPSLMHLIITENAIGSFESSFGGYRSDGGQPVAFRNLRKLMLAGNALTAWGSVFRVPPAHKGDGVHASLELLRMSRNCIDAKAFVESEDVVQSVAGSVVKEPQGVTLDASVADTVSLLRSFQRLSWLSFAGNPLVAHNRGKLSPGDHNHDARDACAAVGQTLWTPARLLEMLGGLVDMSADVVCSERLHPGVGILGQGASGIVKRCVATQRSAANGSTQETEIAVKFFKRVSSDGSGADEIAALTRVPTHPNIVAPLGYLRFPSMQHVVAAGILPGSTAPGMHRFTMKRPSAPSEVALLPPSTREEDDDDGEVVAVCFPLIDAEPFGKPPTIWTVSDDIFDGKAHGGLARHWTLQAADAPHSSVAHGYASNLLLAALKMAHGILSAVCALHKQDVRLVHGDVYAHNMFFGRHRHHHAPTPDEDTASSATVSAALFDAAFKHLDAAVASSRWYPSNDYWRQHSVFLTDFGASFSYRATDRRVGKAFESIELKAVAVFVRDLYESIIPLSHIRASLADHHATVVPDTATTQQSSGSAPPRGAELIVQAQQLLRSVSTTVEATMPSSATCLAGLCRATIAMLQRVFQATTDDDCASLGQDVDRIVTDALRLVVREA